MENKKTSTPQGWSMEEELKVFLDRIRAAESCKQRSMKREPIYETRIQVYVAGQRRHKPIAPKGKAQGWLARLLAADCNDNTTVTIRYR